MRQKILSLIFLAATILTGALSITAAPSAYIGMNSDGKNDWSGERLYANVIKSAREWYKPGKIGWLVSADWASHDLSGWPTEDAGLLLWDMTQMNGTYAISFTGQATLSASSGTVSNVVYDAATNKTTATMVVSQTAGSNSLTFTNTKRTAASAANTGVTNVKVMRPLTPGSTQSYPETTMFTNEIKALVSSKYSVVRFMDFLGTNNNTTESTWVSRSLPARYSYSGCAMAYMGSGRECPWEILIQFCNETSVDAWICIPHLATDDYITKVAQTFKYGSDGVNPYTSPQTNPVHAPLNANLKVYIEWSNEVWNGVFTQTNNSHAAAIAEVAAGGSSLNFDGETNDWAWTWRRTAKKAKEVSELFRAVFGDDAMMTRVRPVYAWQQSNGQGTGAEGLKLLTGYYGSSTHVTNPHPISYWFYGGGGSSYYQADNESANLTIDNIWTSLQFDVNVWRSAVKTDIDLCLAMGIKRIAYEGGPGMDNLNPATVAVKNAAINDPRMLQLMKDHQVMWDQYGGDLNVFYQAFGDYQWGFTSSIYNLATYKLQAIDYFNANNRSAITYGSVPPVALNGTDYSLIVRGGSYATGTVLHFSNAVTYVFRVTAAGTYNVSISNGDDGSGDFVLYCDGVKFNTTASIAANATSQTYTLPVLQSGLHCIMVEKTGGSGSIKTVNINTGSGQQATYAIKNNATSTNNARMSVHQNPISNLITIQINARLKNNVTIQMFDIMGKTVYQSHQNISEGINQITLSTSTFATGIYTLKLTADNKTSENEALSNGSMVRVAVMGRNSKLSRQKRN